MRHFFIYFFVLLHLFCNSQNYSIKIDSIKSSIEKNKELDDVNTTPEEVFSNEKLIDGFDNKILSIFD